MMGNIKMLLCGYCNGENLNKGCQGIYGTPFKERSEKCTDKSDYHVTYDWTNGEDYSDDYCCDDICEECFKELNKIDNNTYARTVIKY